MGDGPVGDGRPGVVRDGDDIDGGEPYALGGWTDPADGNGGGLRGVENELCEVRAHESRGVRGPAGQLWPESRSAAR
jgi:hypothetical protein